MEVKIIVEFSDESLKVLKEVAEAIRSINAPKKVAEVEVKVKVPTQKTKAPEELKVETPAPTKAPKSFFDNKALTVEDVRKTLAAKKKAGFGDQIKAVLALYNVRMVSDLDPKDYEAVIKATNELK